MPDLSWLAAFAEHPLTLIIVMTSGLLGLWLWKIGPTFKLGVASIKDEVAKNTSKIDVISSQIEEIKAHDTAQDAQIRNIHLTTLKKGIFDARLPLSERMGDAARYLKYGGNGPTKKYIDEELIPKDPELWRTLDSLIKN
jgi:hypothetical protein